MPKQTQPARSGLWNLVPLLASAALTAIGIVACERPGSNDASSAASFARNGDGGGAPPRVARQPAAPVTAPDPRPAPLPPPEALSDAAITGKVEQAILSDPAMQGADVSVNTARGVVALAGVVKSQEQTAIASAHAQRQDGVLRVDNQLETKRQ